VSLASNVSLIVATLDLQLVRLLRDAIRTTDLAGARQASRGDLTLPPQTIEPRPHVHPEPVFDPRPVIHPTPRFEPRPVLHPIPRLDPRNVIPAPPCECEEPHEHISPFQPPWRQLPWKPCLEAPPPPPPVIKVKVYRTDTISKGSLIDFFI